MNSRGRSRFVSNTVALVAQTAIATVLTLAQVKLLAHALDKDVFGLFVSLRGFSLLLAMLAANGLPHLLLRFIPVHESRGQRAAAMWLCGGAVVAATTLVVVLAVVVHTMRDVLLGFAGAATLDGAVVVWFYAATVGITIKLVVYGGLNGLRRLTAQLVVETLSLASILVALWIARDRLDIAMLFRILGTVHALTAAVVVPLFFAAVWRSGPAGGGVARTAAAGQAGGAGHAGDAGHVTDAAAVAANERYIPYLGWSVAISFVALAFTDVDRYLLAQVLSLELLALFHIASRVTRLTNRLLGVPALAFQPEVTRLETEGRAREIAFATRVFIKFNTMLAIMFVCFVGVFAAEIVTVVASRAYLAAVPVMLLLALSSPLSTITAPVTTVMKAMDQVRGALWTDLAWATTYILLIFVLGSRFGLIGVGIAQLLATAVQLTLALRISRLPITASFVVALLVRLVVSAVVCFAPAVVLGLFVDGVPGSIGKLFLFAAGGVVFLKGMRSLHLFAEDERERLLAMLERRGLRVARILV